MAIFRSYVSFPEGVYIYIMRGMTSTVDAMLFDCIYDVDAGPTDDMGMDQTLRLYILVVNSDHELSIRTGL